MSEVISSFKSLRPGSQVFALLMLFLCVILHTMWSGKSLQLLCIFRILCLSVGVLVFSVMWSELLLTSAVSCPPWSLVYECQRVEGSFISPVRTECGMFVMFCMQCCMSVPAVL